jgi:hypothetical protein
MARRGDDKKIGTERQKPATGAVFAAVNILSAYQICENRWRSWVDDYTNFLQQHSLHDIILDIPTKKDYII